MVPAYDCGAGADDAGGSPLAAQRWWLDFCRKCPVGRGHEPKLGGELFPWAHARDPVHGCIQGTLLFETLVVWGHGQLVGRWGGPRHPSLPDGDGAAPTLEEVGEVWNRTPQRQLREKLRWAHEHLSGARPFADRRNPILHFVRTYLTSHAARERLVDRLLDDDEEGEDAAGQYEDASRRPGEPSTDARAGRGGTPSTRPLTPLDSFSAVGFAEQLPPLPRGPPGSPFLVLSPGGLSPSPPVARPPPRPPTQLLPRLSPSPPGSPFAVRASASPAAPCCTSRQLPLTPLPPPLPPSAPRPSPLRLAAAPPRSLLLTAAPPSPPHHP